MDEVGLLLEKLKEGEGNARHAFYSLVYEELRRIAAHQIASERTGHTLQATDLVSEAYLRLSSPKGKGFANRGHFFAAAGEAMRRILIDPARRERQLKHGENREQVEFEESRIVELRFFVGLRNHEIALALGISEKTVRRYWNLAKMELFRFIEGDLKMSLKHAV